MATYTLTCPFLNDDPQYAYGVELGLLFAKMARCHKVGDYFSVANQEQILLLANRLGWRVKQMRQEGGHWFWLVMVRDRKAG